MSTSTFGRLFSGGFRISARAILSRPLLRGLILTIDQFSFG